VSRRNTSKIHPDFPPIMPIQATFTTILPNTRLLPQPSPSAALQPVYLWSINASLLSIPFVSLDTLSPSTKATHRIPCSNGSPARLAYLRHRQAPLLPRIPFPLPLPAQQLPPPSSSGPALNSALLLPAPIKLCRACVTGDSPFPLPWEFHMFFQS